MEKTTLFARVNYGSASDLGVLSSVARFQVLLYLGIDSARLGLSGSFQIFGSASSGIF